MKFKIKSFGLDSFLPCTHFSKISANFFLSGLTSPLRIVYNLIKKKNMRDNENLYRYTQCNLPINEFHTQITLIRSFIVSGRKEKSCGFILSQVCVFLLISTEGLRGTLPWKTIEYHLNSFSNRISRVL